MAGNRYRLFALLLALGLPVASCSQAAQPTATATHAPTPVPPTATMTLPPTPEPPTATLTLPPASTPEPAALPEVDLKMALPEGDPVRGESRAARFGCAECHETGAYGPLFEAGEGLPGIMARGELRLSDPTYLGNASTSWEYVLESILVPGIHIVPGWDVEMPPYFAALLSDEDLGHIMAWLGTFE